MFLLWTMFLAGALHGLGPDHLAAILALVSRERQAELSGAQSDANGRPGKPGRQLLFGLRFALGHVATLLLLAGLIGWLGRGLEAGWQHRLEQLGGLGLVFLGGWLLAQVFRRSVVLHEHEHGHLHGGHWQSHAHPHIHPHIHLSGTNKMLSHPHAAWLTGMTWLVGGLTGFSGARSLLVAAPLLVAGSLAVVLERAAAFGLGIVISMAVAGWLAARLSGAVRTAACARLLAGVTGGLSVAVGFYWLAGPPGS